MDEIVTKAPRTAPRGAAESRKRLLVLGMHRSGTSALTRVLSLLGADLPKTLMPSAPNNNETGFWESSRLYRLHNRLLNECKSSWDDWRALDLSGLSDGARDKFKTEIA